MISREQAVEAGMRPNVIDARLRSGRWVRVHPRVYRPRGAPTSWHGQLMAALLWAGPRSFASHRAAARLYGLEGAERAPVEIAQWTGRARPGVLVHRLRAQDRPETRIVDGLRVSRPERTLLDLAAVVSAPRAGQALDDALRRRLTTLRALRRLLDASSSPGRDGTAGLRILLEIRESSDPRVESELERRLVRLLRTAGLPRPVPQHEVTSRGKVVARLDFAYPDLHLGIETHGYRWHGGPERWRRDMARENRLKRLGWVVLAFTWDDVVADPERVVEEVRSFLGAVALEAHGRRKAARRAG